MKVFLSSVLGIVKPSCAVELCQSAVMQVGWDLYVYLFWTKMVQLCRVLAIIDV